MGEPYVVSALKDKRTELAGQIKEAEKHVAQLRADLVHIDAVLRLYHPKAEPDAIPARGPYRHKRWFSRGDTLPRRVLDTLRASPEPLSAFEIASRIMEQNGLDAGDRATLFVIASRPELSGAAERDAGTAGREETGGTGCGG